MTVRDLSHGCFSGNSVSQRPTLGQIREATHVKKVPAVPMRNNGHLRTSHPLQLLDVTCWDK